MSEDTAHHRLMPVNVTTLSAPGGRMELISPADSIGGQSADRVFARLVMLRVLRTPGRAMGRLSGQLAQSSKGSLRSMRGKSVLRVEWPTASGRRALGLGVVVLAVATLVPSLPAWSTEQRPARVARAEAGSVGSLTEAMRRAFQNNPDIRAQRAAVRGTQESIGVARSGLLPQVSASAYAGVSATNSLLRGTGGSPSTTASGAMLQRGVALTATQNLFDGWRTQNAVGQSMAQTVSAREQLRAIEQAVLLDVATTYLAVFSGSALVDVQRRNVEFQRATLSTTRTRLNAGVVTPTDVSQAEARLSRGLSDLSQAETDLTIARDRFARLVGAPPASRLAQPSGIDRLLPRSSDAARELAARANPAVLAAQSSVTAAQHAIRVAQGQMLPTVAIAGQVSRDYDADIGTRRADNAQLVGRVTVPLFQGGAPEAQTRQAREFLTQAQVNLDGARLQARSAAFAGYAALRNATATIRAATDEVRAAEAAVDGVRRQAEAGLRTTVELLNAQQDAVNARSRLILATSDRLVAAYTIAAATGQLELERLGISPPAVASPQPRSDWSERRDAWGELRNPTSPVQPARR